MRVRLFAVIAVLALVASACSAAADDSTTTTEGQFGPIVATTTTTTVFVDGPVQWKDSQKLGFLVRYGPNMSDEERGWVEYGIQLMLRMYSKANSQFSGTVYVTGTEESFTRMQMDIFGYEKAAADKRTNGVNGFANYADDSISLNVWLLRTSSAKRGGSLVQGIVYVMLHEGAHLLQYELSNGATATPLQFGLTPSIGGQSIRWLEASSNFNAERGIARVTCSNEKARECTDKEVTSEMRSQAGITFVDEGTSVRAFYSFLVEQTGNLYVTENFFRLLGTYFERHPDEIPLSVLEDVIVQRSYDPVKAALKATLGRDPTDEEFASALGAPWMRTIEDMTGLSEEELSQAFVEYLRTLACEYGKTEACD